MFYSELTNTAKEKALVEFMTKYPDAAGVIAQHTAEGYRIADALDSVEGGEYVFSDDGRLWHCTNLYSLEDMRGGEYFETALENAMLEAYTPGCDFSTLAWEMEQQAIVFDEYGHAIHL